MKRPTTAHNRKWQAPRRFGAMIAALAIALPMALAMALGAPQTALAADAQAAAKCENAVCITANALTPVVTSSSGYQATVTITNATAQDIPQATLNVATNALYTFSSRVDMQAWAEGETAIPTRNVLGTTAVLNLAAGSSTQASVSVPADNDQIKAITTWGPKPLRISLDTGSKATNASLCSFLTRSPDGLRSADTPPLKVTVAMPLTAGAWNVNAGTFTSLVSGDHAASATTQTESIMASDEAQRQTQASLISQHPDLQVVADPSYLATFGDNAPHTAATMQNGFFDITAAGTQATGEFTEAGITDDDWKAGDSNAIAWQGQGAWTMDALTRAARQGYTTVIANADFEAASSASSAAAHTGSYLVKTDAGMVTVLASQVTLTRLAQGQATSDAAAAETTEAGQMARYIAQSAFYQMEQPYAERILLVTFAPGMDAAHVSRMITAMEEASWISLSNLGELEAATPYRTGNQAIAALPKESGVPSQTIAAIGGTLDTLAQARENIERFATKVIVSTGTAGGTADGNGSSPNNESSSGNGSSSATASPNASQSASAGASPSSSASPNTDTQALARQDASATAKRSGDATNWINRLNAAQHELALMSLDGSGLNRGLAAQAKGLGDELFQGVSISPTEAINVVSETAQMPVTVSNSHDFPVRVTVTSKTDSMQIVTSREVEAVVPAHGEVQVTFLIRVLTSGHATAHLALQDSDGAEFGSAHETHISSRLQVSDMSGMAIVVIAVLLGVLGLWRQFHRKKDPDE
ncbi:DUF6049 family protein [Bifidobacterium vespertilionis]|uniref:Uncharacterized protein n=1 Tax=Bifidobacterium vespertilionis TaxID=2562524 RepID=A0A5J5DWF6_9BIFI|nr:DUF6049 family protein [Bifidobacterium vespertilionis]KAA8821082.1 hypothetical protein EMO90_04635 [Bifidobacterium vespertilionis]KAA8821245.1 hypothetical protein EM848_11135 [Bifidobacterium vespertilionis]